MVEQARLESVASGLAPVSPGWFVVNAADAAWVNNDHHGGVWGAAPYFSDGSARTLEDVLRRPDPDAREVHAPANATRPAAFTAGQTATLLAFLRAL